MPLRLRMKLCLVANWLKTSCVCEKCSPPMDQVMCTRPRYSVSDSSCTNILVNSLMLSTSTPGGDSCSAMVSEVSMVKYSLMGQLMMPVSQPSGTGRGPRSGGGVGAGLSPRPGMGRGPRGVRPWGAAACSKHAANKKPAKAAIFLPTRGRRSCCSLRSGNSDDFLQL